MHELTLKIPDPAFRRARQIAFDDARPVEDVLVELVMRGGGLESADDRDASIDREREAFLSLHPQLLAEYEGKFVAIADGKLADWDADREHLMERVRVDYPERFVWVSQVRAEPLRTFQMPSLKLRRLG